MRAASNAAHAYPKTESFKVTLAWDILQNADPKRAVRVLNGVIRRGGDGFEPQLRLGKAYAELQQDEKALDAFQAALGYEPGNAEVQRAIAELKE